MPEEVVSVVPVAPMVKLAPMTWTGGSFACGSPFHIDAKDGAAIDAARQPQTARAIQCFGQKLESMKSPIEITGAAQINLRIHGVCCRKKIKTLLQMGAATPSGERAEQTPQFSPDFSHTIPVLGRAALIVSALAANI
jgi:hypothetical protein